MLLLWLQEDSVQASDVMILFFHIYCKFGGFLSVCMQQQTRRPRGEIVPNVLFFYVCDYTFWVILSSTSEKTTGCVETVAGTLCLDITAT